MTLEHEQWLQRAVEFQRTKRYDEAREYALRVIREDGRNPKALWIVASSTNSLAERRNALNMLLRIQPDNLHARQMLNSLDQGRKTSTAEIAKATTSITSISTNTANTSSTSSAIHSIKPASQHLLLYTTVAISILLIAAAVVIAVTI